MMKSSTRILLLVGLALIALNGFIVSAQIQPYNYNHHHYYKFGYSDIGKPTGKWRQYITFAFAQTQVLTIL